MAWLGGIGLLIGLFFAGRQWGAVPTTYWVFVGFIFFFALSISLGNWMDRRSVIRMESDGIAFENGLRSVRLSWPEVKHVAVIPTRLGKRVEVQGETAHFAFKTKGEFSMGSQQLESGFADGQLILETILKECGLKVKTEQNGAAYYARA